MKYSLKNFAETLRHRYWLIILIIIFLFSFILDIYLLTRYSLTYGTDGAFYNIQIQSILQHGYPTSGDPPLVYYLLTPFTLLTGSSFLGIKIGMALLGSLMAFPAYLLTECYTDQKKIGSRVSGPDSKVSALNSKVPALLSAFLITININYFTMIGDFMQNLVGVLFLITMMYFAVKWFENIHNWQKYGLLTILFLVLNLLTHIYTGALAVILFLSLLLWSIFFKAFKTHELPKFELKILGLMSIAVAVCFTILFITYPVMLSKFTAFISSLSSSSGVSATVGPGMVGSPITGTIFLSLPYLLGIAASLIILYQGLKEKVKDERLNVNTLLAWLYLTLGITIGVLSFLNTDYQTRFVFLAFLPIALIIPLGVKYFENKAIIKYSAKKRYIKVFVTLIALVFAFSSLYVASGTFANLKPTITTGEYQELSTLKDNQILNSSSNAVIVDQDFQSRYWVEYILGIDVSDTENLQEIEKQYGNSSIFILTKNVNQTTSGPPQTNQMPNGGPNNAQNHQRGGYSGGFLLPYGPPLIPGSIDKIPSLNSMSQTPSSGGMLNGSVLNASGTTVFAGKYFTLIRIK